MEIKSIVFLFFLRSNRTWMRTLKTTIEERLENSYKERLHAVRSICARASVCFENAMSRLLILFVPVLMRLFTRDRVVYHSRHVFIFAVEPCIGEEDPIHSGIGTRKHEHYLDLFNV